LKKIILIYICKTNKKQKAIKKRYKILLIILFIFIGLPLIAYGVFRLPSVQKWVAGKITSYLSEELHTVVTLEGVDISIFDHLIFEKLYVEDQQKDTLLYVDYLGVNIDKIKYRKELIALNKIKLKDLTFNLKYDTAGVMNLQFVLDAFSSDSVAEVDTSKSTSNWKINCKRIIIENSKLAYYVPDTAKHEFGINFKDLEVAPLNLYGSNFMLAGNSIMLDIDSLSLSDKSGFNLRKLSSNVFYGNTRIDLNKFSAITDNSNIYFTKLKMTYPSLDAFSDFFNLVELNVQIPDSTLIGMRDVAYFAPSLIGFDQEVKLKADIKGPLSDLDTKHLDLQYAKNTRLTTNFKITGLPDIKKTVFNINIDTLTTSITDLNTIKKPENPKKSLLKLPTSMESVGRIYYSGNIKGKVEELVTKGKLITGIGNISANINLKQHKNGSMNINGDLLGQDLAISDIVDNKQLGKFDIIDTLNFNISPAGEVEGVSNGVFNNLELLGYSYESVTFDAIINKFVYQGELKIDDPNIKLYLEGMFVNNEELPKVKFTTKIDEFIPHKLHLYDDSLFSTKLEMKGSVTGLDPDVLTGKLECDIKELTNNKGEIKKKEFTVRSDYDKIDSIRTVQILSDFLDVELSGDIKLTTIGESFQKYLYSIMPSLADTSFVPTENKDSLYAALAQDNNFDFKITLKDLKGIGTMFFPGIDIKPGTYFTGKYNLEPEKFNLQAYCPEAIFSGTKIEEIVLNGDNMDDKFNIYVSANKLHLGESNTLDNSLIYSYLYNDKVYVNLDWNSFLDSLDYSGDFSLVAFLENRENADPLVKLQLDSSTFAFENNLWTINSNEMAVDTSHIELGHIFAYSSNNEKIDISGRLSESKNDTLKVSFDKIQLSSFNTFVKDMNLELNGTMYGNTQIVSVLGNPRVNSVDSILAMQLNEHKLGDIRIKALWDDKNSILDLHTETQLINTKNVILDGKYYVEKDSMDFDVKINRFPFASASPFVQEFISDIVGTISGDISIRGTTKKPDINAGLKFVRSGFKVNYLNTYYTFTDSLFIEKNMITMKRMKINAGRNSFAWLSGKITHKNFENINMSILVEPRNFLFLNTQQTDSSLFYGTVYASGGINLEGDPDNMDIDIKLKTERGTRFFLPLTSSSEVSESDFITFVNYDTTEVIVEEEQQVDLSGMNINFELEATSDAEMQIIMDETVGDMIKVRGMGNLDIKVNNVGDIFLYGTYSVTKGDYLFTLQNLVNKRFIVDPGSTIKWGGDPYNAAMNMTAVYKIRKVPLYDLMKDEVYKEQKTNVECLLGMKGNLTNPRIEFGLNLPDAKEPVSSNVNSLDQNDLNQQILSLLILGQFQPLPGLKNDDASAGGGAVSNNAFEMLSNQLSNWLSKISDDFDIGVNYKKGGEMTSDEVEVALSTQLFNDRVSINTNVGLGGGKNEETNTSEQNSANKIVGDVEIEVKLNKKGSLRSKVFNRTNQRNEAAEDQALYTQGVGVFYRKEFNTVGELMTDFWKTVTLQKHKEKKEEERRKKLGINNDLERKEDDKKEVPELNKDIKKEEEEDEG
jgi:hypothetical protein